MTARFPGTKAIRAVIDRAYSGQFAPMYLPILIALLIQPVVTGWSQSSLRRFLFVPSNSNFTDLLFFGIHAAGWTAYLVFILSFGLPALTAPAVLSVVHLAAAFQ